MTFQILSESIAPMVTPSSPAAPAPSSTTLKAMSIQIAMKETCSALGCSHTNIASRIADMKAVKSRNGAHTMKVN